MIPKAISANELINFPTRTVLLENGDVNYNARTVLFNDVNIGFEFEKKITRDYLAFRTELKWSNLNANRNRVRIQRYIEECMTLCKNLALKANANINETKIIWFYPLSMAGARLSQLQGIWEDAFKAVFPKCDLQNLIKQSESIAPFHYYSKKKGVMTQVAPAVSVDIGGGTTDVVVFSEGSPRVISSFKFGGNAIFGDGFNQSPPTNGYVSLFKDNYLRLLNENNLVNECRILGDILDNTDKSTDFVNYLFSLSSNQNVLKSGAPISFERDLALADDLKIVFIVFYGSMFYHIAQMMKSMALPQPVSIMFSGTGSKTLSLLSGSFSSAEKFASSIFNQVYKDESSQVIRFTTDPSPKELTSKGGLLAPVQDLNVGALVKSHLGGLSNLGMHSFLGVDGMERYAFSQISDSHFKDVVANIEHFGRILEEVDVKINFGHEFGVTPRSMETLRSLLKETGRLEEYVRLGFEMQRNDAGLDDQPLEETLFFYPMVGLLNDLAYKISNLKKENLWRD
jgi:hypothetical protein